MKKSAIITSVLTESFNSPGACTLDRQLGCKFYQLFFLIQVFYEEELDVPLVLFDEVLDHVLRIDRIFRQPQGHVLLIGVSGAGKTTLSRFVAWMNGLTVYQIKVHSKYMAADFDEDLRIVLRRSGCKVLYEFDILTMH